MKDEFYYGAWRKERGRVKLREGIAEINKILREMTIVGDTGERYQEWDRRRLFLQSKLDGVMSYDTRRI